MSKEKPMVSAGNSPQVRYSVAYSTDAERMLRRETKTTVAIKCDPVAPRNDHLDDSRNCCRSIPRFRILAQTCRKYDTLYTI